VRSDDRNQPAAPEPGPIVQAIIDQLLATITDLEPCDHDKEAFALWISTRPDHLLCGFCYQAAQVLAEAIQCAACPNTAGNPDRDAVIIAKLRDDLGAHIYLCHACTQADLSTLSNPEAPPSENSNRADS